MNVNVKEYIDSTKITKLGCNYSPELMGLLKTNNHLVDEIKLSCEQRFNNQLCGVNDEKPILLHFVPRIFSEEYLDDEALDKYKKIIEENDVKHVGIHFMNSKVDSMKVFDPYDKDNFIHKVVERLQLIKEKLGVKLLIENMPYYGFAKGYEYMTDPSFIKQICEKADVGLLLDSAHGQISAWHLGMSKSEFLDRLPLDRIYEVHVSGPRFVDDRFIDSHETLQEEDYEFLKEILTKCNPAYITLEYGGEGEDFKDKSDSRLIREQLRKIRNLVK